MGLSKDEALEQLTLAAIPCAVVSEHTEDGEPVPMSLDRDASDRTFDRQMAYLGSLDDAAPIFRDGSQVPGVGVLLALLRIQRPEHLKERDPAAFGRILGSDRAPEVKTLRRTTGSTIAPVIQDGFDILTYRKGKGRLINTRRFVRRRAKFDGQWVSHDLHDQPVGFLKGKLRVRQVTRLCDNGHQAQIITNRIDLRDIEVAYRMFDRWRQHRAAPSHDARLQGRLRQTRQTTARGT